MDMQLMDNAESREGQATEAIEADARLDVAIAGSDEDPYRKRRGESKFGRKPWCAYFFYFGPLINNNRSSDRYRYVSHHGPIKRKDLRKLITQLAKNARRDRAEQDPRPYEKDAKGEDVPNIWTRKSYLIALVDDPNFRFAEGEAISIHPFEEGPTNHTFFDARDFADIELPMPDPGQGMQLVSAVCVVNHMKRADEEDLELGENERFVFRLHPNPWGGDAMVEDGFVDDGGTNMGPPVPPP